MFLVHSRGHRTHTVLPIPRLHVCNITAVRRWQLQTVFSFIFTIHLIKYLKHKQYYGYQAALVAPGAVTAPSASRAPGSVSASAASTRVAETVAAELHRTAGARSEVVASKVISPEVSVGLHAAVSTNDKRGLGSS